MAEKLTERAHSGGAQAKGLDDPVDCGNGKDAWAVPIPLMREE